MPKSILLFGIGNIGRGDDGLGPAFVERMENRCDPAQVDLLTDFQLQIEHALDLENRELVLFADASVALTDPFEFCELIAAAENGYTTHAMRPEAVMSVYRSITKKQPPPCFLLAVKGDEYGLGDGLSADAETNLEQACRFAGQLLSNPCVETWREKSGKQVYFNQPESALEP